MLADLIHGNRRSCRRYECQLGLRLEHQDDQGTFRISHGVTADLSRHAVRLQLEEPVPVGTEAVTRVEWPFLLQNVCQLELVLKGTVSSVTRRGAILRIRSYEFRTCGSRSFSEPAPDPSIWKVA